MGNLIYWILASVAFAGGSTGLYAWMLPANRRKLASLALMGLVYLLLALGVVYCLYRIFSLR